MSDAVFSPDKGVIDELSGLETLRSEDQEEIVRFGVLLLEGKDVSEFARGLGEKLSLSPGRIGRLATATASILWDVSKISSKSQQQSSLQELLFHAGLAEAAVPIFCKAFLENKRRLLALKGSLGVCSYSYQNLSWRLEVEMAKRSMRVITEPKYLLRLDLVNNALSATSNNSSSLSSLNAGIAVATQNTVKFQSFNLQADHASMKLLEQELQRAVDEVNSVHCQRINRYMS